MTKKYTTVHGGILIISNTVIKDLIEELNPEDNEDILLSLLDFKGGKITNTDFDASTNTYKLTIQHPDLPEVFDEFYTEIAPVYIYHDYGIPAKRLLERTEPKKGNN